jgi:hypothetical protein
MSLDTQVDQLRSLIAQRDEIDRQIGELLSGNHTAPAPEQIAETPSRPVAKKAAKRGGKDDGLVEKINQLHEKGLTIRDIAAKLGVSYGKVYARLDKHPKAAQPEPQAHAIAPRVEPMTQDQYANLQDAKFDKRFSTLTYASEHKIRPAEINAAIKSGDYQNYLDIRVPF